MVHGIVKAFKNTVATICQAPLMSANPVAPAATTVPESNPKTPETNAAKPAIKKRQRREKPPVQSQPTERRKRDVKTAEKRLTLNTQASHDDDIKPKQWTQVQYEMFFEALKEHGLNFSKIADAIGSNRFIVSTFFKRYQQLKSTPLKKSLWTTDDKEKLV